MRLQILLWIILLSTAQQKNYGLVKTDYDACLNELENISISFVHCAIDWMTIVGFPHALVRIGEMLDSIELVFQNWFGIETPEPYSNVLRSFYTFYSQKNLFDVDLGRKTVQYKGVDITDAIVKHEFDPEFDRSAPMGYDDWISALNGLISTTKKAMLTLNSQTDPEEGIVAPVADVLGKTKIVAECWLADTE
jgi:hypothetical protein